MTILPPHNSRVFFRASPHDPFTEGRVCGCQLGGTRATPKVEIEDDDGTRLMVSPGNVQMVGGE